MTDKLTNAVICSSSNSVICLATNLESLIGKFEEFKYRITEAKPDIIFLTETWLKAEIPDSFINIPGFKILRKDTLETRGGVMIMVRDHIHVDLCNELNDMNVKDTLWVWMKTECNNDNLLGVVYRKGDASDEYNSLLLEQLDTASKICKGKLLINGDFNLPKIDWINCMVNDGENSFSQRFYDKLCDLFLHQHVLEPTRQRGSNTPNCLDLVISSSYTNVSNVNVCCPIGKADHSVLIYDFDVIVNESCDSEVFRYDYNKADYKKLCRILNNTDWSCVLNSTDVNVAWDYFQNQLESAVKECVPLVKVTSGGKFIPRWFNGSVKRCIRKKYFAWKRYQETRSFVRYQEYVKRRNAANKKVRAAKRDFERNLCKRVKKNPKAFYMYVNNKTKCRSRISKLKSEKGTVITDNQEMSDVLNDFFQSVFVKEEDKYLIWFNDFMHCIYGNEVNEPFDLTGHFDENKILDDIFFSPIDIKKLLLAVNPNKSMGPDEVHPRVLKESAEIIYLPLFCILRQSLDQCKLPDIWKRANITPIHKKGDKAVAGNYRPVSLTSQICKLCEKLVRDRLVSHLEEMLSNDQHGFRRGRSCLTNLLVTLEEWTKVYDEGLPFDALYLDFQKAFDSVPAARLMYKLDKYGIRGKLFNWIENFLSDRKQRVCLNGSSSSWRPVTSGVPQGSVIGPILFLVFINDMPGVIESKCKIFADDTKVYHPITSLIDKTTLQNDIDALVEWSKNWLLGFNENKCKVIHFGKKNPCYDYVMKGKVLENVAEERDLGVLMSNNLSFSKHIAQCAAKANNILGMIKKTFSYLDKESFLVLYKSFIRPHLEYCVQAWSPFLEKDKDVLEKVQKRALKLLSLPELEQLSYKDKLATLGLTTLEERRTRGDLIEMYKLLNDLENVNYQNFFELRRYPGLRGHALSLEVHRTRLNVRKYFFSNRAVALWNSLPEEVVLAPSVNVFKNRYDSLYKVRL